MSKVSFFWRMAAMLFLGFCLGVFVTIKVLPPSQDINIGRIKIKGKGHTIEKVLDVNKQDVQDHSKNELSKKELRKLKREERRSQ